MAKKPQKPKARNYVVKHSSHKSGAGTHVDKKGEKAPRVRQKRQWKKEMQMGEDVGLIASINEATVYDSSDEQLQSIKDIEKEFNIDLSESFTSQQKADMSKLIAQYKDGTAKADSDAIASDLEMLEYQPDEIPPMIQNITAAINEKN